MTKAELEAAIAARESLAVWLGLAATVLALGAGWAKLQHVRLSRELKALSAPRALSAEQQSSVANTLRPFAGQKLNVFVFTTESEIVSIGNQIVAVPGRPNGAGWALSVSTGQMAANRVLTGMLVEVMPSATEVDLAAARALVSALAHERLGVGGPQAIWTGAEGLTGSINEDPTAKIRMIIARRP